MSGEKFFLCPSKGAIKSEDVTRCSSCNACYHPSCSSRASPLPDGSFKKCCGDLSNRTLASINSARSFLLSNAGTLQDLWKAINAQMSTMRGKISSVDDRLTNMDSKLDLVSQLSEKVANVETRLLVAEKAHSSCVISTDSITREVQIGLNARIISSCIR